MLSKDEKRPSRIVESFQNYFLISTLMFANDSWTEGTTLLFGRKSQKRAKLAISTGISSSKPKTVLSGFENSENQIK